jgi:hypothetical protein
VVERRLWIVIGAAGSQKIEIRFSRMPRLARLSKNQVAFSGAMP